ncbi:hypothetical protein [uncultured Maribacter sp.]|uniref:hypothetical protein n=1 Tax=uncultured Maribacter sp. TaxID=431308 RepID=UPI00260D9240|nr:hypothetical protein [uncultured Maribacter sp.]
MRNYYILVFLLFSLFVKAQSDTNVSVTTSVSNALNLCGDAETVTVTVTNLSPVIATNIIYKSDLPIGISVESSLVLPNTGSSDFPFFEIPAINPNETYVFSYTIKGTCEWLEEFNGTIDDETEFEVSASNTISYSLNNGPSQSFTGNSESFNVRFAELEVKVKDEDVNQFTGVLEKDTDGTVFTREIEVRNSGLGKLSEYTFYVDIDNRISFSEISLGGQVITPTSNGVSPSNSNLDRYTYVFTDFTGIGNNDSYFDQDELFVFEDKVSLLFGTCESALETNYTANWGCDATFCNVGDLEATSIAYVSYVSSSPSISFNEAVVVDSGNLCSDVGIYEFKLKNNVSSSSVSNSGNALDVFIIETYGYGTTYTIGGISFPDADPGTAYRANLKDSSLLTTDPDGIGVGLEDVDKDGYYDDLPAGNSIVLRVTFSTSWNATLFDVNTKWLLRPYGYYSNTDCNPSSYSTSMGHLYYSSAVLSEPSGTFPSEISTGETAIFEFSVNRTAMNARPVNGLIFGGYYSDFVLPLGFSVVGARWSQNPSVSLTVSQSGNTYRVFGGGNSGSYELDIVVACPDVAAPEIADIKWDMYLDACSDYSSLEPISIASLTKSIFTDYDCPGGGGGGSCDFVTDSFNVDRNTFGYVDPSSSSYYTNNELSSAPRISSTSSGIELNKAYPLDKVIVEAEGRVLQGTVIETYNTLFFEFAYNRVNEDDAGLLNHQTNGSISVGGSSYTLSNPQITVAGERITYLYTVTGVNITNSVEQQITVTGLELQFPSKSATSLNSGAFQLDVFRAKFYGVKTNGDYGCTTSQPTDFSILIPELEVYDITRDITCTGITDNGYFRMDSATGSDDFPNEYRPLLIFGTYKVEPPSNYSIREGYPFSNTGTNTTPEGAINLKRVPTRNDDSSTPEIEFTYENHIAADQIAGKLGSTFFLTRVAYDPICDANYQIPSRGTSITTNFTLTYIDPLEGTIPQTIQNTAARRFYVEIPFTVGVNTTQEGFERTVSWPVVICNEATGGFGSQMTGAWTALELKQDDTRTKLLGATDENGVELEVIFYGGQDVGSARGMLVKTENISAQSCKTIYPRVAYIECVNDQTQNIELLTSWSCGEYPLEGLDQVSLNGISSLKDFGVLSCQYRLDEQEVTLRYKTGDLSWEVNRLEDEVDLCEAMPFEIKVVSSKFANVYDTDLTIQLPQGIGLEDIANIQYQYDGQTGLVNQTNFIVDNSTSSNEVIIKVSELVTDLLVTAAVPGIVAGDNTIPGSRLLGKNEIIFNINFVADCNMDPGIPIRFDLDGTTNCGDSVNLVFNRSLPIKGVILPDLTVDIQASDFVVCNNQNEVEITLLNNGAVPNVAQQELKVTLPAGVSYGGVVTGFDAPVQTGNVLTWDIDDINTNLNQSFKILTTLTNFSLTELEYKVDVIQNGEATCIQDSQACDLEVTSAQDTDISNQITLPSVTITPITSLPVCEGSPIVLSVALEGVTDYSTYAFNWNIAPTSINNNQFTFNITNSSQLSVSVAPNGNNSGSCTGSANIDVDVYPGAALTMTLIEGITCSSQADGKATVQIIGENNSGYTEQQPFEIVSASPTGVVTIGQQVSSGELITVENLPQGPFRISFRDNYGCTFERTLNIPLIANPITNFCTSLLPCGVASGNVDMSFNTANLHSSLNGTNYSAVVIENQTGTAALNFTGTFPDNQTHALANVSDNARYTLELTATNGCVYTRPFVIDTYEVSAAIANDNGDPNFYELCFANDTRDIVVSINDNIPTCSSFTVPNYQLLIGTVDADGAYEGTPQVFNDITNEITFEGIGVGTYKITVKPASVNGYSDDITLCEEVLNFNIISRANFKAALETKDPLCAGEESGSAEVIINGGTGSFTYAWSQSGGADIISTGYKATGLPAGNYQVMVTDENGCPNGIPLTFTLTDPAPLDVPFIEDVQTACEAIAGGNGGLSAAGYSSGVAPYTFTWYEVISTTDVNDVVQTGESLVYQETVPEGGTSTYPGITAGDYKVVVKDANGCTTESLVTAVTQPEVPRKYNICLSWKTKAIKENQEIDQNTFTIDPIGPSNFKLALTSQVDRCIAEAQEVAQSSVQKLANDIESLQDAVQLEYTNGVSDVYHYTLYYYDRAGNLTRTVPPEGVNLVSSRIPTSHTYVTGYDYNSIAQLGKQNTPDGGTTNFLYNDIGQLLYSQNERQIADAAYSYSIYDDLGRIIEAGEATLNGKVFPTDFLINDQANEAIAKAIPLTEKAEYIQTTFNEKALVTYQEEEQRYLRNRVSQIYNLDKNGQETKTYYSYDPHGNVEWIIQDLPGIGQTTVAYKYDLISGNVNSVVYNKDRQDEYHHAYSYDEDNRIVSVKTSKDGYLWDEDARYDYYLHGPLARTEIGEDRVQGLDFTYTIHGWLKGINTPDLVQSAYNPDGLNVQGDPNTKHAKDEFGMALGYYEGDFTRDGVFDTRLTAANPFVLENQVSGVSQNLYNGNISTWTSQTAAEAKEKNVTSYLTGNAYRYDQLNRIKEATTKAFNEASQSYAAINGNADAFRTNYTYDGNGNLETLKRYKDDGQLMDDLAYNYDLTNPNLSNKLTHVNDAVGQVSAEINDLPNQNDGNYMYDAIGQLSRDNSEGLTYIWNTSGKVSEIVPDNTGNADTQKVYMKFTYNGLGNRIAKMVNRMPYDAGGNGPQVHNPEAVETTYYSLDAQGNVMGIYKREDVKLDPANIASQSYKAVFKITERPMYGSDRIGQDTKEEELFSTTYNFENEEAYNSVALEFKEAINQVAFSTVMVAQNSDQELFDVDGNSVFVPGTNIASAAVDGAFVDLLYNSTIIQDGNSTPIDTDNNIFLIEDVQETPVGYGVVASSYFNGGVEEGVLLIYDTNGNIIPGLQLINADTAEAIDALAKSVVVKNPARDNEYLLFYKDVVGGLHTATLSTASGSLEVASVESRSFGNYGRHMAVVDDRKNKQAYIYATTHSGAVVDVDGTIKTPPQATVVRFVITETGTITEEGVVIPAFDSYDTKGNGELQISLDGKSLNMYNYTDLATQWTGLGQAEIRTWPFNQEWLPIEENAKEVALGGNIGKGSVLNTGTELYYTQRTHEVSTTTETVAVKRASDGQVLATDLGDLRANKNDNFYYFAQGKNQGAEYNLIATNTTALANLPVSDNGATGFQPYQPYTINGVTAAENNGVVYRTIGKKYYELKDHLGNVRVVVSDRKNLNTTDNALSANVVSYNNYYPFGMLQPNRNFDSQEYRYGFQGQEKDSELKGEGNSLNYKYRMHDPRIGRFFAVDPLIGKYPYYSSYSFSGNRVIDMIELEGKEPQNPKYQWSTSDGYKSYGDFYKRGGHLALVQGWWVYSDFDNETNERNRFWNPEKGKWIQFDPMPPKSLSADLESLGKYHLRALYDNTTMDLTYTLEAGVGEADYIRFMGYQFDKGLKASGTFKILELNGLDAFRAYYEKGEFEGINQNSLHVFDGFSGKGELKYSKGIYAGSGSVELELNSSLLKVNGEISGSYSIFSLSGSGETTFNTSTLEFVGSDKNLDLGIEFFDLSKKGPAKFKNGMDVFHNLKLDMNIDIDGFIDSINKPIINENSSRKVKVYDDNP